ncbi:MAG: 23S rRNA (uracil(1939)-C(5))-methyltransferase RlmD, partial [Vampirovibrionia bacterium]
MKHVPKEVKVKIHSLGHCAEGIGRVVEGEDKDITVFVENTTSGDLVLAETFAHKKAYLKAQLKEIIEDGDSRIKPKCSMAKICGGCQWQHVDYNHQLSAKKESITSNIQKITGLEPDIVKDVATSPDCWNYRAKVQLPVGITKKSKRLLVGYYKPKTHEIVNIKYCPVQPEIFNEIVEYIRELHTKYFLEVYNEKTLKGYLRHILLRKSFYTGEILLTFVINSRKVKPELQKIADKLVEKFSDIRGITVNVNSIDTNVILGPRSKSIYGYNYISETLGNKTYNITDKSFFQVNPQVAEQMFEYIKTIIQSNNGSGTLLDIYAGVCAISIYVSDFFEKIVAIENDASSEYYALQNCKINSIENIEYFNCSADEGLD